MCQKDTSCFRPNTQTRYLHYCIAVAKLSGLFTTSHIENCLVIFQLRENASLCASSTYLAAIGTSSVTSFTCGEDLNEVGMTI